MNDPNDSPPPNAGTDGRNPDADSNSTISTWGHRARRSARAVTIDGYHILDEISHGAQGAVYEAVQLATKRIVAVKVLIAGPYASAIQRQRFRREIDLLASLRHANIVTIYDSGITEDNQAYLAMEYIHGQPLDSYVSLQQAGIDETLAMFRIVCDAVDYAHRRGVIHRDLKPGNVLVDTDGVPHILDFGLAKAAGLALDAGAPVTETGSFLGTLAYASPEQTVGDPSRIDTRSDIYSLGVILYELLTGSFPYTVAGPRDEVFRNIREQDPIKPSMRRKQIDSDLDTILLKTLAKDEEQRYQSADALARDIDCYVNGEPIAAKRASLIYLAEKKASNWIVRHPVVSSMIALVVAFFAAMVPEGRDVFNKYIDQPFDRIAHQYATEYWPDDVVVVAFTDDTHERVDQLAEELGLTNVRADNGKSLRSLHGSFMRRLSTGRPRVVAWDIYFATAQPDFDSDLVAGIDALHQVGAKVVTAFRDVDLADRPVISAPIAAKVDGLGWLYLRRDKTNTVTGTMLAEVWPPRATMPSLSLATFAAAVQDGYSPNFNWNGGDRLHVGFTRQSPVNPRLLESSSQTHSLLVTEVETNWKVGLPSRMDSRRRVALYTHTLGPSASAVAAHTVFYESVFSMDQEAMRKTFEDKVIIIGDNRVRHSANPDRSWQGAYGGSREEFSCYMHAAAICDLLTRSRVTRPTFWARQIVFVGACLIGLWLGWFFTAKIKWASLLAMYVFSIVGIVGVLFCVASNHRLLISPTRSSFSLVIAALIAAKAASLKRRHDSKTAHPRKRRYAGTKSGWLFGI